METIKCVICIKERPKEEVSTVFYKDEFYVVCVHCVEAELIEAEVEQEMGW